MLDTLKAIRDTAADLARLQRKLLIVRSGGRPVVVEQTRRQMAARTQRLAELDGQLQARAPVMFSAAQCNLPAGEDVLRTRGDTGVVITLHGGEQEGRSRLTIANVGLPMPLEVHCRPQDVNLLGFLLSAALTTRCPCDEERTIHRADRDVDASGAEPAEPNDGHSR